MRTQAIDCSFNFWVGRRKFKFRVVIITCSGVFAVVFALPTLSFDCNFVWQLNCYGARCGSMAQHKYPLATHNWKVVLVHIGQPIRSTYRSKADTKSYPSVPSGPKAGWVTVIESTIKVRCLVLTTRWIDIFDHVKARAIFNLRKLIYARWIF